MSEAAKSPARLLSRKDVAQMLNVHTETVKRWQRAGRLRACILGPTVVRYDPADVARLIAESVVCAPMRAGS